MTPDEGPDGGKQLVCGVCEELLPGSYSDEREAEEAIEEHEITEHPDLGEDEVVVVHVSNQLVDLEGEEGVVEIAKNAQDRLDSGDVGESLMG
ncbi:hypothetical protein BRD56_07180 [Thermoplasmatales archaeon SW_10_69_26]|jgi:hypothetical protein|nr:MAG: hypothetical protein BRD56_07180 [Thermoplasmatales archaeon SW_10_69_26]